MAPFIPSGNRTIVAIAALVLGLIDVAGCEGLALVGRESLKFEPGEVVAEVERLDDRSRQIHLRPNNEGVNVVTYDDDTRVIYRGRELSAGDLQAGDVVVMTLKENPAGHYHSDFFTIRERRQNRDIAQ
jgi:hypothetical protein